MLTVYPSIDGSEHNIYVKDMQLLPPSIRRDMFCCCTLLQQFKLQCHIVLWEMTFVFATSQAWSLQLIKGD